MPGKAAKVVVSERQLAILEELRRSRTEPLWVVKRAHIIVLAWEGRLNQEIARQVSLDRMAVGTWRRRWQDAWDELTLRECTEPTRLRTAIRETHQRCPAARLSGNVYRRASDSDFGGGLRTAGNIRPADHALDQRRTA